MSRISSSDDVRRLPEGDLPALAAALREEILRAVPETGGHFASNLGAVELTVSLHRCFDVPRERIFFDVGHQAYAHKLLTGRADRFSTLRQAGGLSGFTNREESPADASTAGHSGSALSLAVGAAISEKLAGSGRWTVAFIGDGSFTNGMAYEALNTLSGSDLKLCIVLNDNEMSISKNVGGLSRHLSAIRTSRGYFRFKLGAKRAFSAVPLVGRGLVRMGRGVRDFVKRTTGAETFFEKLGLEYIGPVDGNDVGRLLPVFREAKSKSCPVIVHAVTQKGLGYPDAEAHPERYHSVSPFDPEKGVVPSPPKGFTAALGEALAARAKEDERITAVTAAMTDGCGLGDFAARFPDRFFDVGIAEEHAAALAGGMALGGLAPVVVMYSTFAQRIFDQLWHDVALQGAHVILCLSHAGLVPGDGVTHQGIWDAALLSRVPGVVIRSPSRPEEVGEMFDLALADPGLSVIRYPKGGPEGGSDPAEALPWIRKDGWKRIDFGTGPSAAAVVTYGRLADRVARAAEQASDAGCGAGEGWRLSVLCLSKIVPLPADAEFWETVRRAGRVLFVEEGIRSGGIGEALAADERTGGREVRIRAIGEPFLPHGDMDFLERRVGIDPASLRDWMREELSRD